MLSKNITVYIFARNEAGRIVRCIKNFNKFFQVVVVDNCSSDGTDEVSRANGCEVLRIKNPGFIETPEVMLPVQQHCKTEYLLIASVSEFVPFNLLSYYAHVANSNAHDVVVAYRESVTSGLHIPISGGRSSKHAGEVRFFKKYAVDYTGNLVHGRGAIVAPPGKIASVVKDESLEFYQYRDYDSSHTELKHREYNDVVAKQLFDRKSKFHIWRLFYHPAKHFFYSYIRSGCWRFGMLGFMHSYYRFQMEVGIWFRVWEYENGYNKSQVVFLNSEHRMKKENDLASHCKGEV